MAFNYLTRVGNAELVKQLNYAMIYRLIVQRSPISRIQLAEISQLAPASITKITRQLIKSKLIKEIDVQQSTGGRPAVSIIAQTTPFQSIAIQLSRTHVIVELYDLGGHCLASEQCALYVFTQTQVEEYLIETIKYFMTLHSKKIKKLIAISIVLPGLVDAEHGRIKYTPHIKVENWALSAAIKTEFNISCFLGNDVQSLALAEHYFGASQDVNDSILIRVHHGVGSGVIINRQLFINNNKSTGEVGHIQVDPIGDRCHCGNFGCLENTVINRSIERHAKQLIAQGFVSRLTEENSKIEDICHHAKENDMLASQLIRQAGQDLGRAIAILVNLFNPQKIVIAGKITDAEHVLFPPIYGALNTQTLKGFRDNLKICRSRLDDSSAIGAFALVQEAMFNGSLLMLLTAKLT